MDQKPLNYSPLPDHVHAPSSRGDGTEPHLHHKVPTAIILIVVFMVSAAVAAGLVVVQSTRNSMATPTQAPVAAPTVIPTPTPEVSSDDSLDTIDREVLGIQTSTSSVETTSIEKDMQGL